MLFGFVEVSVQRILTACYSVSFDHIITENHSAVLLWSDVIFWNKINSLQLHMREAIGFLPKLEVKPVLNERDFWAVLCFDGTAVCSHPSVHKQPIANVSTHSALGKIGVSLGTHLQGQPIFMFPSAYETQAEKQNKFYYLSFCVNLIVLVLFLISFCEAWCDSSDLPDGQCSQILYIWTFDMFLTPLKWRLEIWD